MVEGHNLGGGRSTSPSQGEVGAKRRVRAFAPPREATIKTRALRRASTDAEWRLWHKLKNRQLLGLKFVRQFPVGPYVADFACRERGLIVEVDGGQHSGSKSDSVRDRFLNEAGYSVLRFWNDEVLHETDATLTVIIEVLEGRPSPGWRYAPATLSPWGRGKE